MIAEAPPAELLAAAGLSDDGPFTRAFSYTNDVFVGRTTVLRLFRDDRPFPSGAEQELQVLGWLGPDIPHSAVRANGTWEGRDWVTLDRLAGQVLSAQWHGMSDPQRREVIGGLAQALHALHQIAIPNGWQRADLAPDSLSSRRTPLELSRPYQQPPQRIHVLAATARSFPDADVALIDSAETFVTARLDLFAQDRPVLVHTDLHWDNLMTDGTRLTGVLDFEDARVGPADLDLDVIIRFCWWPHLPVAPEREALMRREDFVDVPKWLRAVYPELFAVPNLVERLRVFAILHDLRQAIHYPENLVRRGSNWGTYARLQDTLEGNDYFAELL